MACFVSGSDEETRVCMGKFHELYKQVQCLCDGDIRNLFFLQVHIDGTVAAAALEGWGLLASTLATDVTSIDLLKT